MLPSAPLIWLATTLLMQTAENPPLADAASPPAAIDEEEFIEVIYKGQTIRVPIRAGQPGDLDLGDAKWKLSLSRADERPDGLAPGNPSTAAAPQPQSTPAPPRFSTETIALLAAMGTLLTGVLGYFFVYEPMRRRRSLNEALRIIQRDLRPQYPRAEELLDQSLLAGLGKRDIARARFALAYLRGVLGKLEEAATVLGDLEKSRATIDRPTAYLMLWVQSRLKNHERVERIFNTYEKLLAGYQQSALIVSISYLALAQLRWARREINGAMHYFDLVRELKVLADEVPTHIGDHEVVMGTMALFEKNHDEAVKHFKAALTASTQRGRPTHPAQLGLLLCEWRQEGGSDIDEPLRIVLRQMQPANDELSSAALKVQCSHCGKSYKVKPSAIGKKVQCRGCRRRFTVEVAAEPLSVEEQPGQTAEDAGDRLLGEDDQLLRNARLWHCLSRVRTWFLLAAESGLDESERALIRRRLDDVIQIDPEFGDPHLMGGLIDYYFAADHEERKRGREQIERAVQRDVHVPEVLQLLDREHKLSQLSEQSLIYFHKLSADFAGNAEVDPELRERFVRSMNRYSRFRDLGAIDVLPTAESVAPSLENLQGRGQILQTRVTNIVRYRLTDSESNVREEIEERLGQLQERNRSLTENAKALQQAEFGLMESTGEFLFSDDQPVATEDEKT